MSEKKFRAWDKNREKYVEVLTLHHSDDGVFAVTCADGMTQIQLFAEDVIVEQYTGIEDKSGAEAVAGDIVRDGEGRIKQVVWGGQWEYAAFGLEGPRDKHWPGRPDITWDLLTPELMAWCEIIGNIHDNLELLEARKP